jgi:hypothetical protein
MKKYTSDVIAEGELDRELNKASEHGWQLVHVVYAYERNYLVVWVKTEDAAGAPGR